LRRPRAIGSAFLAQPAPDPDHRQHELGLEQRAGLGLVGVLAAAVRGQGLGRGAEVAVPRLAEQL
jgi:hypothetical protein